ncbi:hypothetical protein GVN20_05535 [Runella sp. CRIBMP]|uniref:hypothetical protein n=1 Tax=Runella sp. CRIBMP TaxID=2683261 RepID=UPI0014131BDE|nr:hypothetical protein [Runella sp. CRIBMP]NBB18812.1 hypothetical protein [Runella sp. CRIBMP]
MIKATFVTLLNMGKLEGIDVTVNVNYNSSCVESANFEFILEDHLNAVRAQILNQRNAALQAKQKQS